MKKANFEYIRKKLEINGDCWEWIGYKNKDGYGRIGGRILTHVLSWNHHYGDIPKGLMVCHSCDNPPCVNPKHLWLGTCKQNQMDSFMKGRRQKKISLSIIPAIKSYAKKYGIKLTSILLEVDYKTISNIVNERSFIYA